MAGSMAKILDFLAAADRCFWPAKMEIRCRIFSRNGTNFTFLLAGKDGNQVSDFFTKWNELYIPCG
jgi:hypothetical protein